jgi:alginate O-acetyltransferase complex protein AlgI
MLFSSVTFLFYFLPLALAVYYGALQFGLRRANFVLFVLSLFFYFWGEREYIVLFLGSISFNYFIAWLLSRVTSCRRALFIGGLAVNLGALAYFKYAGFIVADIGAILGLDHNKDLFKSIRLPLGISFFTFHGLSYLFDIYRGTVRFRPGKINMGLYIALFPQLIAGPIVRYKEIANQFEDRNHTVDKFIDGIYRFVIGLAKKVLIADQLGVIADYVFGLSADRLTPSVAWCGIISYTLQIYFDFSGYSDMAIGLAKMFGFSFPENFNLPYTARSIRDFWQRWHITLSNWFRDYLYIPLGGNRGSARSTACNLSIVFVLCGLWHGASWNFVIWGALHGFFIALERGRFGELINRLPVLLQRCYAILIVMLLWVPFRAETLSASVAFWQALFGLTDISVTDTYLVAFVGVRKLLTFALAIFFSLGLYTHIVFPAKRFLRPVATALLFILALAEIASGSYSPFIYFRF